jgi:hypothetical protein
MRNLWSHNVTFPTNRCVLCHPAPSTTGFLYTGRHKHDLLTHTLIKVQKKSPEHKLCFVLPKGRCHQWQVRAHTWLQTPRTPSCCTHWQGSGQHQGGQSPPTWMTQTRVWECRQWRCGCGTGFWGGDGDARWKMSGDCCTLSNKNLYCSPSFLCFLHKANHSAEIVLVQLSIQVLSYMCFCAMMPAFHYTMLSHYLICLPYNIGQ